MKVKFYELDGCFAVALTAESMQEAAELVRFGVNRTTVVRTAATYASKDGTFETSIVLVKHRQATSTVVPRR